MRLPNGYGSVVFLGKKRRRPYAVRLTTGWSASKKQQYKYLGYFENKKDALQCLADFHRHPYDVNTRRAPLSDFWADFEREHSDKVSKATMNVYRSAYAKMERLHDVPISELRAAHFQSLINGQAYSTARIIKILCGLLFKVAIKAGAVDRDFSDLLELPKKEKKQNKKPFTVDEVRLIEKHEGEKSADMLLILLYSGLRISELLEMEIANVDLESRVMIGGLKTEAGKNRTIPIHKKIQPIIARLVSKNKKYLFESPRGLAFHYSNEGLILNRFIKKLGMDHTIHETRHSFISQCGRLGFDKFVIKKIVGHSVKDITEHYTHKTREDLLAVIDSFSY